MRKTGEADDKDRNDRRISLERYLLMNEKEKDAEIQKAIIRLQKRIQEILYMLEADTPCIVDSAFKEKKRTKEGKMN